MKSVIFLLFSIPFYAFCDEAIFQIVNLQMELVQTNNVHFPQKHIRELFLKPKGNFVVVDEVSDVKFFVKLEFDDYKKNENDKQKNRKIICTRTSGSTGSVTVFVYSIDSMGVVEKESEIID